MKLLEIMIGGLGDVHHHKDKDFEDQGLVSGGESM